MMPPIELDSIHSSFRETMLEHVFIAELQQEAWFRSQTTMEILRSEVDDAGYDLVAEFKGSVRYIQLKGSRVGGKTGRQNVNSRLSGKPGGCVVWLRYKEDEQRANRAALEYLFFGGKNAKQPLPSLGSFRVAPHTKANAQGIKAARPGIRVVPKSAFEAIPSAQALMVRLFG